MKSSNRLSKLMILALFVAGSLAVLILGPSTEALTNPKRAAAAPAYDQGGYGLSTGVVGVVEGQFARLIVWNKGKEAVFTKLQFVDDQGKVLITFNGQIPADKSASLDWPCCGGGGRVELQAQLGTVERRSIGLLVPTVQIIDGTSYATSWMIGPEGFTEIRPIWVP